MHASYDYLTGERYAACKGLVCAVTCLVLHSVMRHPHSPKNHVRRQGLIPPQISISGEVSLLARVCPELPLCVMIRRFSVNVQPRQCSHNLQFILPNMHCMHMHYAHTCINIHTHTHTHTGVCEFHSLMPRIENTKIESTCRWSQILRRTTFRQQCAKFHYQPKIAINHHRADISDCRSGCLRNKLDHSVKHRQRLQYFCKHRKVDPVHDVVRTRTCCWI